jgi:hypothetical protein
MSSLVSAADTVDPGAAMESFVHLRKGKTRRRLHADLDRLKDDELGRAGFTGRTANMYRRHVPAYRAVGPLRPLDLLSSELKRSDATEHGTMADPRWLDPTIDPNERTPGTCYLGDPQVVNMSPVGLARFSTLRSWLSQWSYDDAHGDGLECGPDIAVPALVIGNLADACTPSHTRRLFDAIGHPEKEMFEIAGANHNYACLEQRGTLRQAIGIVTDWLIRHDFAAPEEERE